MPTSLIAKPPRTQEQALSKAYSILCYAHDTVESLLKTLRAVRSQRGARGSLTDEEQDLLRAMLVFASAGLDSMAKQVIHDTLPQLTDRHDKAKAALEVYATRRLGRVEIEDQMSVDTKFLARVLVSPSPRSGIVEELVRELTAGSLQSPDEVLRVVHHLGMDPKELPATPQRLRDVFVARNRIIHEMDIDFSHVSRNRRTHTQAAIVAMVNELLAMGHAIMRHVAGALAVP